jgi:hypothetical protein
MKGAERIRRLKGTKRRRRLKGTERRGRRGLKRTANMTLTRLPMLRSTMRIMAGLSFVLPPGLRLLPPELRSMFPRHMQIPLI